MLDFLVDCVVKAQGQKKKKRAPAACRRPLVFSLKWFQILCKIEIVLFCDKDLKFKYNASVIKRRLGIIDY